MSARNQHTTRIPRARVRVWQKRADLLLDSEERIKEDKLVTIFEMVTEGLSYAAVAGMFRMSPGSVPAKAAEGEAILKERKGKNQP